MPSATEQTVFKSKFGPIAILTPTTFNEWHTDCTSVLSIMGADSLLDGTEPRPLQSGNARNLWDEKSIRELHATRISKPKGEKIQDVLNFLNNIRVQLSSTSKPISDEDMLTQLVHSLPQDDQLWRAQGIFILSDHLSLQNAILHLKSCEVNHEPPSLPQANSTRGDRRGTGRGDSRFRKGKFRGRAQYEQGHSSPRRGNFNNSRGYSRPGHRGSKIQSNQCRFCLKIGHHMHECEAFSRHQKQELEKQSKSKDENENRARGYVINSNDVTNENDWPYFIAAPCMTGRALSSSSKIETIIDSGATEHFSGAYNDFKNLKRWREPRPVTIADGNEVLCEGTGALHIRTSHQTISLNNVWYVPECHSLSISTWVT
ncbi:hypothetical protein K3495_g10430 [Podosphaera aphanis]|nr:hypothetical protein K3495_g10430 [Podosphaera aphanis]